MLSPNRRTRLRVLTVLVTLALAASACSSTGSEEEPEAGGGPGEVKGGGWTVLHYSMADTDLEPFMVGDVNELGEVGSNENLQIREFIDRSAEYGDDELLDQGSWVGARVLDLADLTAGISSGLEQAGVEKLDLLGFDACLMASYEVASAMAPYADRMVASQELEPGHGWDYGSLQVAADDPELSADALGEEIIAGFVSQAEEEGTQDGITLSMVDLEQMDAVDEALAGFAGALAEDAAAVAPIVGQSEVSTLAFGKNPDQSQDSHLSDLGLLAAFIGDEAESVVDPAAELVDALDSAVLSSVDGTATSGATGLSIYFPPTAELADGAYQDVSSAGAWSEFLVAYYGAGEAIPEAELPVFENADGQAEVSFDDDGSVTLNGSYAAAGQDNLTDAVISYAFANDDGSLTYFGEEIASVDSEGAPTASGNYDLTALTISDGIDTAYAYLDLDLSDDLSTAFIDVPMTYYAADDPDRQAPQDVLLSIVLDVDSGEFVSETLYSYDETSGGYGELVPDAEGILVPDVLTITADGEQVWEPTSEVGLYAELADLTYDVEPLEPGTVLQVDLTVTDFGGNTATVSSLIETP